jgi:hypothetical protein
VAEASLRASRREAGLRSRPATCEAPRRARERVSVAMWHWRWTTFLFCREGRRGTSKATVVERREGEEIRVETW